MKRNRVQDQKRHEEIERELKARKKQESRDEINGIFSEEKYHEVRAARAHYYDPIKFTGPADESIAYSRPSIFDRCGEQPGTKQLIDAGVPGSVAFRVYCNMFRISYQKKKSLRDAIDAVNAVIYDDILFNNKQYKPDFFLYGKDIIVFSLLAESLGCDMHELLLPVPDENLKKLIVEILEKLDIWDVDYSDDGSWTTLECDDFEYSLDMSPRFRPIAEWSKDTITIEKIKLKGNRHEYSFSYHVGGKPRNCANDRRVLGRGFYLYSEETGLLQEFTDKIIAEDRGM